MKLKKIHKPIRQAFLGFIIVLGFVFIVATGGGDGGSDNENDGVDNPCDYNTDIICEGEDCFKVCDLNEGAPENFILFNNSLLFTAYEGCKNIFQLKLFEIAETGNINEICELDSLITDKLIINDVLYFVQAGRLWKYDGSNQPQGLFPDDSDDYSNVEYLMEYNDKLYFSGFNSASDKNVSYSYDELSDVPSIAGYVIPFFDNYNYTVYNNRLYFRGFTIESGTEIWCYDESSGNQYMAGEINPTGSAFDYTTSDFVIFQDKLFFSANDGQNGEQLWMIDDEDTMEMITNFAASDHYSVKPFAVFNGKLLVEVLEKVDIDYTTANMGRLYEYDGTNPVSPLAVDEQYYSVIYYTHIYSNPYSVLNGHLYFLGHDVTTNWDGEPLLGGVRLWDYSPGEAPVRVELDDGSMGISNCFIHNNKFILQLGLDNIYIYDGVSDPQQLVFPSQSGLDEISLITGFNDNYFISGRTDEEGRELWKMDGSGDITLAKDFYPGTTCWCFCD